MSQFPAVMTAEQVAQLIGVNTQTVYRLSRRGEIPYFKVGNLTRFSATQIEAWINGQI